MGHTEDAVVSSDLVGEQTSCLLDSGASEQLAPDTVKLVAWSGFDSFKENDLILNPQV